MKIVSTATYSDNAGKPPSCDADNNVLSRTTRNGDTISFSYDNLSRVSSKTSPAGDVNSKGDRDELFVALSP